MQQLSTTKQVLILLYLCPTDNPEDKWVKRGSNIFAFAIFGLNVSFFVAFTTSTVQLFSINLEDSLFSLMSSIGIAGIIYSMTIAFFLRQETGGIFENLSAIYENYGKMDSNGFMAQADNRSERLWSFYFEYLKLTSGGMLIVALLSISAFWFSGSQFNADDLYHPTKIILLWDQSTRLGYIGEILYTSICGISYTLENGVFLILFISMCLYHRSFYKMIKYSIDERNRHKRNHVDEKYLCNLIRFYVSIKEWFSLSAKVYSSFIMIELSCCALTLALTLFHLDLQIHHLDFFVITLLLASSLIMTYLFLYCYFGKVSAESFEKMADCVYEMQWQKLPLRLQKYVIMMIENMQRPLYFYGFKVIKLELNTFIKLFRTVITYFFMFKTLTLN